jgi:hypothetical protein
MGEFIVTILIFIGVLAVSTVLFGGWVFMFVVRGARRFINGPARMTGDGAGRCCGNVGCRLINPLHARFCRRCGSDLGHIAGPAALRRKGPMRIQQSRSKIAS